MRFQVIIAALCTMMSLGLVVIIVVQHKVLILMEKAREKQPVELESLNHQLSELRPMEESVEKLLNWGDALQEDLESTLDKLAPVIKKRKMEIAACQAERKSKADELAVKVKEHAETEAILKSEFGVWMKEVNKLRSQVSEYRPICDHVRNNTIAMRLCGDKGQPNTGRR